MLPATEPEQWLYEIETGDLYLAGLSYCSCYSGHGVGLNNPAATAMKRVGPLPVGWYTIGRAVNHPHLGPFAMPLVPDPSNVMFGRSGFWLHADTASHDHTASDGCIVIGDRVQREGVARMVAAGNTRLHVVTASE